MIGKHFGLLAAGSIALALCVSGSLVGAALVIVEQRESNGSGSKTNINGKVSGSCSANGVNNTITCAQQGPSMANVAVVESAQQAGLLWFDGPPHELPKIPSKFAGSNSCRDPEFMTWARSTDRLYLTGIEKDVVLTAGDPDLVVLTGANLIISSRQPRSASDGTWIKCIFGGGGITYSYELRIESQTLKNTLTEIVSCDDPSAPKNCAEVFEGPAKPMPPASVALGSKSVADIRITVLSKLDHAYSGKVAVASTVNGADRNFYIGTDNTLLRWVGFEPTSEEEDWYATDNSGRWVKNWSPACGDYCND
ncbi:hypothetical protein [Paractinoplanes atraurantiacus]|nr:hypothetical protein [Actinoplanes atraurantiacus]